MARQAKTKTITVKTDEKNPEPLEILAKSIIQVSAAADKLLKSGLNKRAIIVLLQESIGSSNITRHQIGAVLDHLPLLKTLYTK